MADLSFEDGRTVLESRTKWTILLAQCVMVAAGLVFLCEILEVAEIVDLADPNAGALTMAVGLVYVGFLPVYLASVVLVCMWIYRAHSNLRAAGYHDLEFTPGWAVGWYFIPIANLFKPFQAMRELWNTSHLAENDFSGEAPSEVKSWWFTFIGGGILSNIGVRIQSTADFDGSGYLVGTAIGAAGTAVTIASAYFLIQVLRAIMEAQRNGLNATEVFS